MVPPERKRGGGPAAGSWICLKMNAHIVWPGRPHWQGEMPRPGESSMECPLIYCDNAATSFPKPPAVAAAMTRHLQELAVNPGRSGYDLAIQAAAGIDDLRRRLGQLFNNPLHTASRTVFTSGATAALVLSPFLFVNHSSLRVLTLMRKRSGVFFM